MRKSSLALAIAVALSPGWTFNVGAMPCFDVDPHKPRPRSKGEKARNKRYRR